MQDQELLLVSSSPHVRSKDTTRGIMTDVVIALLPAMAVAIYVFGLRALTLTCVCSLSCVFFEWVYRKLMKKTNTVGDMSAVVTGVLIVYCVPISAPYWMVVVGAFFAIIIVKQLFGGIGKNFMNPALAARAFLFSWPVIMTTWAAPFSYGSNIANIGKLTDVVTAATPLASLNVGQLPAVSLAQMFVGTIGGSLGEVSAIALIIGGAYLVVRKVISLHIPVAYVLTVALLAFLFPGSDSVPRFTWMMYEVLSGGVILGAIFMATDYATSPVTKNGQIIFGVGCGLITMFIRFFGSYVEGVSYAILIMNTGVWLIDKATVPRRFGVSKEDLRAKKAAEKKSKEGATA